MRRVAFPRWPVFSPDEIEAAACVLRSGRVNYWTGDEGRSFEHEFAASVGCEYGIALANGTVALEIALRALGVGPGDEVIVPSRTFIATASSVVAVGARPVVVDVDRVSQNLTVDTVRPAATERTRAMIAVHLAGWPTDMGPLVTFAREHGLAVVEDCAQAHGATYHDRPVGSLGDAAAWSFCQDKILTTAGEGGMLTTSRPDLFRAAWAYKDHGKDWDAVQAAHHSNGFRWVHESFGSNARMHEVAAAVGRVALHALPCWLARRRENADRLADRLRHIAALRLTDPPPTVGHAYYKWYAFVRPEQLRDGWSRDRIVEAVRQEGIPCFSGSCSEIYLEKAFPPDLRPPRRLPVARELGETSLMLLVHPTLRADDMDDMAEAVDKVLAAAS